MSIGFVLSHSHLSFSQKCRFLGLVLRTLFDKRFFQPVNVILKFLATDKPVVVDVGANVGNFSKAVAKQSKTGCTIIAVEPSFYVYSILAFYARFWSRREIEVRCRKVALGDRIGVTTLHTPIKPSGSLRVGLANILEPSNEHAFSEAVPLKKLDDLLQSEGLESVDLVKMDVEGAELLVLSGAEHLFKDLRPVWFVEVDDDRAIAFGKSANAIFKFFFDGGYRAFVFDEEEQLYEVFSLSASADYLFIHHESELLKTMGA